MSFLGIQNAKAQQVADFSASSLSECESLITAFTDNSTGNPVSWKWDFGNGNTSTLQNPKASYVKTGKYTVTLTASYADGSSKTATKADYIHVWSKPVVDFSLSTAKGCAPFITTFTDKSKPGDGSLQAFSWDYGDGGTDENAGSTANHSYTLPGVYNVILTVTNSYGCTNYKMLEKAVTVSPAINADFNVTEKILCKAPVDVLFTNTSTGPGTLVYKWDFDDGGSSNVKDPAKHTFNTKGTHSIKLTVSNELGCTATKTVDDINVANYSTSLTVPSLVCTNNYSDYAAVFSTVQPQSTTWEFNGAYTGDYSNNTARYYATTTGPLKIKLTAMYGNCTEVVEKTVDVKPSPAGQLSTDNKPICTVPATVNFQDNSTGATSWSWNFGDGQTSAVQSPTHVYNTEGDYYVTLLATSKEGCTSNSTGFVFINETRVSAYASNNSGCEGLIAGFSTYSNSSDQVTTYLWNFGDGTTSTEATPQHTYNKAGTYPVSLKYTTVNGCTGTVNTDDIQVYKKPVPDFTSPDAPEICGNTTATFIDKSDVGTRWEWFFGDDYYGSGSTSTHNYSEPGTYDITLTVWNETCSNTIVKEAYVKAVNPFPRFTVIPVDCDNRTTVRFNEASLGATSWKWSWGDGKDTSYTVQSDIVSHIYTNPGTYTIQLTTSDGHCTTYLSASETVFALSPITINSDKTALCGNESITASIVKIDNTILNDWPYYWQLDDATSNGNYYALNQTYTNITPGPHTIRLLAQNKQACFDTSNVININVRGPLADYNLPALIQCRGTEVTFTDNTDVSYSSGITKWDWNFGDNTPVQSFTSGPFKHTYLQSGSDIVPSVTVTDKDGCVSTSAVKYLQVNGPDASFFADNYLVKPGSDVSFTNTSAETGGNITDVRWDFGDGNTSNEQYNILHNYPDKGVYDVKLHLTDDNGCEDETKQSVKVSAVAAGFDYTSSFVNGSNCAPMVFRFNNVSINYTTCTWDFGDGGSSDQFNPVHTYTESGHYKVTLKVKGDADTEDESVQTVIVKGPFAEIKTSAEGGCLEKEILFTIQPQDATSFSWDFTDGDVEQTDALEIKHNFKTPGIYNPRLILKDDAGCKGSAFLDHPVVIDQLDIELHPTPEKICDAGTLTFAPKFNSYSVDELGMVPDYTWTYDPSLTPTGIHTTAPEFYLDKTGEYKFSLSVTTAYGCKQTVEVPVNVYTTPLAVITGPDKACMEIPVTFSGSVTNTTDVTWGWEFGNGQTSSTQQPAEQLFSAPDDYNITLTVSSKEGCSSKVLHPIHIWPLPDIKASAPAEFICLNTTTLLQAGGGGLYEWSPAESLDNPSSATPRATPAVTTTYQVKVTDNNGCINTDEVNIRVVQPFTVQATPDTNICLGDKLPLHVSGADNYTWKGDGIDNAASTSPVVTLTGAGQYVYEVTGYDKEGCFSDKTSLQVNVHPAPLVNVGPDREIMAGTPVYLAANNSNDVIRWRWSPAEGLDCSTCARVQVLPNLTTRYHLEVENTYGCKASDDVTVHVLCNQSAIFMPTAFTPNHDGQNERIYPKGTGVKEIEWLRIYDRWGTLLFENTHFPINTPSAGWDGRSKNKEAPIGTYIYFMQTICEGGEKFEFKGNITLIK